MKKTMNTLILLIIIFVVIIITLLILLTNNIKEHHNKNIITNNTINYNVIYDNTIENIYNSSNTIKEQNNISASYGENYTEEGKTFKVIKVHNQTKFYTVSNCVQRYLDTANEKNAEAVLNMLSSEYKTLNNITKSNVFNYTNDTSNLYTFTALKMNFLQGKNTEVYSVYGKIIKENEIGLGEDIYFIVRLCTKNNTFDITPLGNQYNNINDIEIINDDIEIVKNENNMFVYYEISDEEVAKKYLKYFKDCMLYNPEAAYNQLEKSYREKRFGSIEEFKKYLEENQSYIIRSIPSQYAKRTSNSYTLIDNYGNYYIFDATAVMQYAVKLDNYTIETVTYLNKYNSYSDEEKVLININKFISMINSRDYNNAYELLNATFKERKLKSVEDFKTLIKNKTYEFNESSILEHNVERRKSYSRSKFN